LLISATIYGDHNKLTVDCIYLKPVPFLVTVKNCNIATITSHLHLFQPLVGRSKRSCNELFVEESTQPAASRGGNFEKFLRNLDRCTWGANNVSTECAQYVFGPRDEKGWLCSNRGINLNLFRIAGQPRSRRRRRRRLCSHVCVF
jgi:hypothetical protein